MSSTDSNSYHNTKITVHPPKRHQSTSLINNTSNINQKQNTIEPKAVSPTIQVEVHPFANTSKERLRQKIEESRPQQMFKVNWSLLDTVH